MNWINSLLFDTESIAHLLILYAFVISVGVLLGKVKFRDTITGQKVHMLAGLGQNALGTKLEQTVGVLDKKEGRE